MHLQADRPSLSPRGIIIIDIQKKDYCFQLILSRWSAYLGRRMCPACGAEERLSKHACYSKHYYREQIQILRVRCGVCRTTHALMPSFSLPDTSVGTEEAERYLMRRHEEVGRGTAGKQLLELGVSQRYGLQLERMFTRSLQRAKALFPDAGDPGLQGMRWVHSVVSDPSRPLYSLNCFCLQGGVNPVCFCRASILRFHPRKSGGRFSHNLGTSGRRRIPIHCP